MGKEMRKALLVIAAIGAFGGVAKAEYLFWQLNNTADVVDGSGSGYTYAAILYTADQSFAADEKPTGGTALSVANEAGETISGATHVQVDSESQQVVVDLDQLGGNQSMYSYYIEYYNYGNSQWNTVGTSKAQTYAELATNGAIYTGDEMVPITEVTNLRIWTGGTYGAATPEPSAGMLLFVGITILGLKRKKANGRESIG